MTGSSRTWGATPRRIAPVRAAPRLSRYCAVAVGRTATEKLPSPAGFGRGDRAPARWSEVFHAKTIDSARGAGELRRASEHVRLRGLRQREDADAEPRGAETERATHVAGLGRGLAAGSDPDNGVSPGRRVRRRPDVEQAAGRFEQALQSTGRHEHGTPDVVRRDRVVRIGDTGQVRRPLGPDPDVLDGGRPASRGRVEVRDNEAAAVREHLAGRLVDGGVGGVLLLVHPAIDLAADIGEEVERAVGLPSGQRVRSRRHGLGLQDLRRPVVRNLRRDDAVEVLLEPDHVDRPQSLADLVDLDRSPVAAAELQRLVAGEEHERRLERGALLHALDLDLQARADHLLAHDGPRSAGGVANAVRRLGRDRQRRLAAGEQDPYLGDRRLADRRPAVVMREDAAIVVPSLREAVRAPLAHPDTVAPAAAADQEDGLARPRSCCSLRRPFRSGCAEARRKQRTENDGCRDKAARHRHLREPGFRRNLSEASASSRRGPLLVPIPNSRVSGSVPAETTTA